MTGRAAKGGFTLVEVIVVGVLLIVLALGAYSFFMLYLNESREATANFKMERQAEAFFDELARKVRVSHRVVAPEDITAPPEEARVAVSGAQTLLFLDDDDNPVYGFRFRDNIVEHSDAPLDGGSWRSFSIDGDALTLVPGGSGFGLDAGRVQVDVNLALRRSVSGGSFFDLLFDGRSFRCRIPEVH